MGIGGDIADKKLAGIIPGDVGVGGDKLEPGLDNGAVGTAVILCSDRLDGYIR